jgi:arylsulfatase A-like enzyme/Flp pilus assembly protein TadD
MNFQTSGRIYFVLIVLLIIIAFTVILWLSNTTSSQPISIRNVLLISIDTCRADYLSCYGYKHKTTPNIDKLAKEGILFENVISPVPLTLPAHCSILTGTIPPYHGVHANVDYKMDQSNETLAQTLKANNFTTGAIVSSFVMDSQTGLDKGFDSYNDEFEEKILGLNQYPERRGSESTRFALDWLDNHKDKKFFLFLHYYDPHETYQPPEPFASKYRSNPYAGEIAFTDDCIGKVLTKLKELGLYDSTLIIITSDHGEMLGEHGERSHGYFIYQSAIKVPLIFKLPGRHQRKVVKEMVGLIDIIPTLYSLIGIELPSHLQGVSLVDFINGNKPAKKERNMYCETFMPTKYDTNSLLGVLTNRFKYIQTTRPELYDLIKDPQEKNDLIKKEPQKARILKDTLEQILEQSIRSGQLDSEMRMSPGARQQLESLGYVGGKVNESFDFDQTKEDPKDFFKFYDSYLKCKGLVFQKKYKEAETLLKENIRQKPDVYIWYSVLAEIAMAQRNYPQAIVNLKKVLSFKPDNFQACNDLGIALQFQGKLDEAADYFRRALKINPNLDRLHFNLALILEKQEKQDLAIISYRHALEINPGFAEAHHNLGIVLAMKGDLEEAVSHYFQSVDIEPGLKDTYAKIADKLAQQQENAYMAVRYLRLILQADPESAEIHFKMAVLLAKEGRFDQAIENAEKAIELATSAGNKKLTQDIQKHLECYRQNQTYNK